MSICADQLPGTCKNMYMLARLRGNVKSRAQAEGMTYISERTLAKIETDERLPKPEEVLAMADAYEQPTLAMNYCQHECPVGQRFMTKAEHKDLAQAVLGIVKEHRDVKKIKDRLIEIAADGVIDDEEKQCMEEIFGELQDLERAIKSLKLFLMAEGHLDVGPQKKEKALRSLHETRASYETCYR